MKPFRFTLWPAAQKVEPGGIPCSATRACQLESNLTGVSFNATIQATWRPMGQRYDAIVFNYLRQQANTVTGGFSVLNPAAAADALNVFFGRLQLPDGTGIQLVSAHATLGVADDARDIVERRERNMRQADADTAELAARHAYLIRLRELFLCDPPTAMLWWADGDRNRILQLVGEGNQEKKFGALVSMLAGTPNDTAKLDKVSPLVASFLTDLDADDRRYLTIQLAEVFKNYRRPDLAEELRRCEFPDMSEDGLRATTVC